MERHSGYDLFLVRWYPEDEMSDYPDSGHSDPSQFKEDLRKQLFKVTLIARKDAL
ncbi:hypothetical protein GGR60_003990 [Xanthomonas arboricola]|nr:hypothetical protein [Xanthomonas euroxanthea]